MVCDNYDFSNTRRVMETKSKTTANKKLYTGWVLIGVVLIEKGFIYCLALPGRPPEKKEPDQETIRRPFIDLLS